MRNAISPVQARSAALGFLIIGQAFDDLKITNAIAP
jgi:hypothetical protein